jgi:hypothetical protein
VLLRCVVPVWGLLCCWWFRMGMLVLAGAVEDDSADQQCTCTHRKGGVLVLLSLFKWHKKPRFYSDCV